MSGPVSSWSRRRAAVAKEAAADAKAAEDALIAQEQAALAEKTDAEILEELGLPDPDQLVMGDDFKVFLSKSVPQHLRQRALRKLWRSNPVLACVDGLNDYDDDYLTGSTGQGVLKTTYQVGKGMLAHLVEIDRQNAVTATLDESTSDDAGSIEVEDEAEIAAVETPQQLSQPEDTTPEIAPSPRRMQFQFADAGT